MPVVTLRYTRPEDVTWPARCCACDAILTPTSDNGHSPEPLCSWPVTVKKGLRFLWDNKKRNGVRVNVCRGCRRKLTATEVVTNIGVGLFWLAIGGYVVLSMQGKMTPELTIGAGGTFWLGCILVWSAGWIQQRTLALKIHQTLTGEWRVRCKSATFADELRRDTPDTHN